MQSWLLTASEDEAMQGMTTDAQVLYMRCFRRFMDFYTGFAGESGSTITYQSLKRLIEFIPDKHSSAKARRVSDISTDYIRSRLAELERGGLIAKKNGKEKFDHLVFFLPLARIGKPASKTEPQQNPKELPQAEPQVETHENQYMEGGRQQPEHQGGFCQNPNNTGLQVISTNVDIDIGKKPKTGFSKPTIAQLRTEIKLKGFSVDAEKFFHYYESNGWMVGKTKMRNWKSALVTWNKNSRQFSGNQNEITAADWDDANFLTMTPAEISSGRFQ